MSNQAIELILSITRIHSFYHRWTKRHKLSTNLFFIEKKFMYVSLLLKFFDEYLKKNILFGMRMFWIKDNEK
jgi:hypothetical protein